MNIREAQRPSQEYLFSNPIPKDNLDFGKFSRMPEYIEVNRSLTETLLSKLPVNFFHVDVAAGTGMVEKLLKDEAEKTGRAGTIIGVDPNPTSLTIANKNVVSSKNVSIEFIEGLGQNLKQLLNGKMPEKGVDSTSIHDALHEIRDDNDKVQVIQSMTDILKPGGLLTFNSAFTTEGNSDQGLLWGKWKAKAMLLLNQKREERGKVKIMPTLSPESYRQMIENAGLTVIHEARKVVTLTREALEAISKYPAFFNGALEDMCEQKNIPEENKSNALIQALKELNIPSLRRVWYEIIAQKPASTQSSISHIRISTT